MSYFSRRNQHVVEFSGHEEVSPALRRRLFAVLQEYVRQNQISYSSDDPLFLEIKSFYYEVQKEFPGEDPFSLVQRGEFHETFTVVEIFLDMVTNIDYTRREKAFREILQAFRLSGSVYTINGRMVELEVDEKLAKKIEEVKSVLVINQSAYEIFFDAVGGLVGRRAKAEDVVKDVFIAFEDYLKEKTSSRDYNGALLVLEKDGIISPTQKAVLSKIYAYRSDSYGVGHAGNSSKPEEIDALWFVETVTAQLLLVDRKLKQQATQT